jgi:hypothetical protein
VKSLGRKAELILFLTSKRHIGAPGDQRADMVELRIGSN